MAPSVTIPTRRVGTSLTGPWFGETDGRVAVGGVLATDDDDADRLQNCLTAAGDLGPLLRVIMPIMNEAGAPPTIISDATEILSRYDPDPRDILFGKRKDRSKAKRVWLADANEPRRLALEMLVHEESERRWLAGELESLEAEWVRADQTASIADGLTRDPAIETRLTRLQEGGQSPRRPADT